MLDCLHQATAEGPEHCCATHSVARRGPRESVTDGLRQLHWLPVSCHIKFKLCCLMYYAYTGICPMYVTDIVHPSRFSVQRPRLRSATTSDFFKTQLQSKFGERAFSYSGPQGWNDFPLPLREAASLPAFKKQLKTCLFISLINIIILSSGACQRRSNFHECLPICSVLSMPLSCRQTQIEWP